LLKGIVVDKVGKLGFILNEKYYKKLVELLVNQGCHYKAK